MLYGNQNGKYNYWELLGKEMSINMSAYKTTVFALPQNHCIRTKQGTGKVKSYKQMYDMYSLCKA